MKEENEKEHRDMLKTMGKEENVLYKNEADAIRDSFLKNNRIKAIFDNMQNGKSSGYVCYSASDIKVECTKFASNRGGRYFTKDEKVIQKAPNPIITWSEHTKLQRPNGKTRNIITSKQFWEILDAKLVILY